MKKQDQKRLDEALDKALAPPRQKPKQNLDALLNEYDDEQISASSHIQETPLGVPATIPVSIPSAVPVTIPITALNAGKVKQQRTPPLFSSEESPSPQEQFAPLDATHTGSEKVIYSIMYRETISKGIVERHFGPAELMKKSGIRSRNTVHKALYSLVEKLSVEITSEREIPSGRVTGSISRRRLSVVGKQKG